MDRWSSNPGWSWLGPQRATPKRPSAIQAESSQFLQRLGDAQDGEVFEMPSENIFGYFLPAGSLNRPISLS
jgi:hypothetical protein